MADTHSEQQKSSVEKKRRRRRAESANNELIVNENMNPNQLINGSAKPEEINGNSVYEADDDNSAYSESIVFQMNETLRQREALIKQLSERLQTALQSRDHITQTAECMASQIDELKNQLKLVSNSLMNRTVDGHTHCHDFECQTEWTEESSIEESRRQSESASRHSILSIPFGVQTPTDQTIQSETLCENSIQTDLHQKCKQELELMRNNLMLEFSERQRQIEAKLSEQVNQLEGQLRNEKDSYLDENQRLDSEIERLKSYICDLEKRKSYHSSEDKEVEDDINAKSRISRSLSPLLPYSGPNASDFHPISRSPIFQTLQNCNNWPQTHPVYNAQQPESDIENIEYVAQTPIENSRLLHVLSDLVKTFIDTEHDIHKHLIDMGIENRVSNREELLQSFVSLNEDFGERLSETNDLCEDGPDLTPNSNNLYFTPPSGQNEVEEDVVLGASRRLRTAVDRVLKLLSEIVSTHSDLDFNALMKKNEELLSELNEECVRRNKLTSQLIQIEDRVKSLEKEKMTLSEKVIDYNETKRQMETMRVKLNEYESERDKWINDNKRLENEKCSFAQGLPELQKILVSNNSTALKAALLPNTELLSDNEGLNSDVLQLQQERIKLLQRIHALALETEQLRSERDDILDEKRKDSEDYIAQIEANEKNLLSYRKFIDEQTHERELERDEYNKELLTLTERLKDKDKSEVKLRSRLEEMETQISCLTEEKCFKEKEFNDANNHLKIANSRINEMKEHIKQIERETDKNGQNENHLRSKIIALNEALDLQIKINEESHQEVYSNNIIEQITSKTHLLQNTLGSANCDSESEDTSIECSFNDVHLLSEKLNALNECIDQLLVQNNGLKRELEHIRSGQNKDVQQLVREKDSLERNLTEILRSNEILKEELNSKHLQLSAFKSRLESTLDSSDLKFIIEEMQSKLLLEEQKCKRLEFELSSVRQQSDERSSQIRQLLDEVKNLKHQMKTFDSERGSLVRENDELRLKLSSKEAILNAVKQSAEERVNTSSQMTQQIESYKKTIQTLEIEKSSLCKINDDLKTRISGNEQIIVSLKHQIEENLTKESKLKEGIDLLNAKIKVLVSDKNNLNKENNEMKNKLSSLNAVLLSLNEQIEEKNSKTVDLIARVDSLSNKLKFVESEKVKYFKDNDEMKCKLSRFDQLIHELKCQVSDEQIKSLRFIEEIDSLKTRLRLVESEKEMLLRENSSLKAKLHSNEEVLNVLKQQLDERNRKIKNLNEIIDKLKTNFMRFESDNKSPIDFKRSSGSGKLVTNKTTEEEEREISVNSHLLWKLKRVISHKNALVHQKKYLLHVLGGFQLTERATLALLANMNVTVDDDTVAQKSGKSRFRSAAYAVIAVSRMKFLVRKWATRSHTKGKTVTKTVSANSLGLNAEPQTDSTLQEFVNRLQKLHDTLGLRNGQT